VLLAVIVGWAVPVAATERVAGEPSPADRAAGSADVFTTGATTPRDADEDLWLSWSLVDTVRDRRVGSANSGTERTNSESSIKAWIAADYLRVAHTEGRAVTSGEQADIAAAVRRSDNAATQRLYHALGGDAMLRDLRAVCGVAVTTSAAGYWSLTQISAVDATRIFACVLRTAPGLPGGADLLTDLRNVEPDGAFGIKAALPPTTTVSVKNGWMPHTTTGEWNVNCVAAWDDYVLAVLTRYPVDRPLSYGADVCRDVTAAVVGRLG
ncbi:MAG TPA: hypothetical protein VFG94_06035, partial [Acidimicrobiales bacterium]|nr:hypothetical protein [Acidimicrobiales bacterium]